MSAIAYVRREFEAMRRHLDALTRGLTGDELTWLPPGTANAIGATLLHVLTGEDRLIQRVLLGRSLVCDEDGWQDRIGVPALPVRGHDWRGVDLSGIRPDELVAYADAVQVATAGYLASLADDDLDEEIEVYGQLQPRAEALLSIVIHNVSHAGEIAALKGVRGTRGRPT